MKLDFRDFFAPINWDKKLFTSPSISFETRRTPNFPIPIEVRNKFRVTMIISNGIEFRTEKCFFH